MTTKNDGGPAFPFGQTDPVSGQLVNGWGSEGMSKREGYAMAAMQGMLAHPTRYKPRPQDKHLLWHDAMAKEAFEIADAMIAARENT